MGLIFVPMALLVGAAIWVARGRWTKPEVGQARLMPWAVLLGVGALSAWLLAGLVYDLGPTAFSIATYAFVLVAVGGWLATVVDRHVANGADRLVAQAHGAPIPPRTVPLSLRMLPWLVAFVAVPIGGALLMQRLVLAYIGAQTETGNLVAAQRMVQSAESSGALGSVMVSWMGWAMAIIAVVGAGVVGYGSWSSRSTRRSHELLMERWIERHPDEWAAMLADAVALERGYHAATRPTMLSVTEGELVDDEEDSRVRETL